MRPKAVIFLAGVVAMALVTLHPPWIARAVLTRMSFRGFPQVPPTTIIDSVSWRVPFAALYSRPSLDLPVKELSDFQARLAKGDTSAARDWQKKTESVEQKYKVPDSLRSVWRRDSVPGNPAPSVAYTRSVVSTRFDIDRSRLLLYLTAIAIATAMAAVFTSRR